MPRTRRPGGVRDPFDPFDGPVDHTIDLHGLHAAEARAHVEKMLDAVYRKNPGALVHIITGRGRGSAGAPVLKGVVRTMLRSEQLRQVEEWATDLDEGGYLIRLKGRRR